MPIQFDHEEARAFARTEFLTNIAYLETNRDKMSAESKLHTYELLIDAIREYLEAEETEVQNGRPSSHRLPAAKMVEGAEEEART
jgi:hypothetical protein